MNPRRTFVNKIIYLAAIALLLIPLFWLSQPATRAVEGSAGGPGGKLAQLRAEQGLSEANLGEIDPTGETIKLATLGMRGVATSVLWSKANRYEMKKDWVNMSATLNQISKLEPHFITVWRHQAWKVSYNVSSEFDDYRARYRWVINGIDFLKQGIRYNQYEPGLYWDVAWFTAQKIGRADEARLFRELFKEDDDFHGPRPVELRDNWLVGKEWFIKATELANAGYSIRGLSPVIFFSQPAMSQMNYADALEADGTFGQKARVQWQKAEEEWAEYGDIDIPTSTEGISVRLNDLELIEATAEKMAADLEVLAPGVRDKLAQEKRDALTDEERHELDVSPEDRDLDLYWQAYQQTRVAHEEVAEKAPSDNRVEARKLAADLRETETLASKTNSYRKQVNFEYWRRRAQSEQLQDTLEARSLIYEAERAFADGLLPSAKDLFDAGFAKWRTVLDNEEFPELVDDPAPGRELMDVIHIYVALLDARDEQLPEDFILQDVIDKHAKY